MQEEKKVISTMRESLHEKLCKLFLHTFVTQPQSLIGQISKHLEIPEDSVTLKEEKKVTDEKTNVDYIIYKLFIFEYDFILRFEKRVEKSKEIEVPKVVNQPKKWYQRVADKMIITEKKKTKEFEHLLLCEIQ